MIPLALIAAVAALVIFLLAFATMVFLASRKGGWGIVAAILGGGFLLFFLLAVPFIFWARSTTRRSYEPGVNSISPVLLIESAVGDSSDGGAATTIGGGSAWLPDVEETLRAYVYPSSRSAARALGREIADRLEEVLPEGTQATQIWLRGDGFHNLNGSMIMADVAEVLRKKIKSADVVLNTAPNSNGPESLKEHEVSVRIDVPRAKQRLPAKWDKSAVEQEAVIQAHVRGHKRGMEADAEFVDKPWVDRFDQFISTRPQSNLVQARSREFASSEHEARQQAIAAAADALAATLLRNTSERSVVLMADNRSMTLAGKANSAQRKQLAGILAYHLNTGRFIADRFPQRLQHRYDDMWREALLIRFGPLDAALVMDKMRSVQHHVRRRRFSQAGSLVGMLVFVCVGYLVLNAATKGYYRGLIVTGCVAAAVLFLGALLFIS